MFLCVVYYGYFCWNMLVDNCMGSQSIVVVEYFNLVVIGDIQIFGIGFT